MRNAAMPGLQKVKRVWIGTTGGRGVHISALHVDVRRWVHRGSERRTGQPRRRPLQPAARVVRHSGWGVLPAARAVRTTEGGMERDRGGGGGWGGAGGG